MENIIQLGRTGIVYENIEEIESSIFQKVYERAFALTKQIVHNQNSNHVKAEHDQIDNIITFVGRRGTGKTSAMLSFMEFLKKNTKIDKDTESDEKYCIKNKRGHKIHFISLEWIDASLLEKKEDIFEYILAKMLREVLNFDDEMRSSGYQSYEVRELHQKFSSIYKKALKLKNRGDNQADNDSMAISMLRDLARSSDLRKEFEQLIKKYIQMQISRKSGEAVQNPDETYLVVAIDDMDMNVESGFEILEKVQRYLKVENLLVLLAINHEQMAVCCEKHFSRMYETIPQNDLVLLGKSISRIAEEYLEKALPSYMRVYLPSMKKKDYDRERLSQVKIKLDSDKEERKMSIKEAIFRLIEIKTKVRYDSAGKKRHFMEPGTLRQLNNQYLFFSDMKNVEEKSEINIDILDQNMIRSMDDILFRFAFENLPQKEREYFLEFSEVHLRRRGGSIVNYLLGEIDSHDDQSLVYITDDEKRKHWFKEVYEIFGYSYGELMRCLFFMGRESAVCDKKLVHAILAMYTITLTKIFYRYKIQELEKEEGNHNYKMLKYVLTDSAAGSWALFFTPLDGENYTGAVKHAALSNKLRMESNSEIHGILKKLENCKKELLNLKKQENRDLTKEEEKKEELIQNIAESVGLMEDHIIALLFLSNFTDSTSENLPYSFRTIGPMSSIQKEHEADERETENYEIEFDDFTADFNVLNIVNNIFSFEERIDEFIRVLISGIENTRDEQNELIIQVKEKISKDSLYCEMNNWQKETGGALLPFYSTDIYYNLLKRLAREGETMRSSGDYFKQLKKLLTRIEEHLKKSDELYSEDGNQGIDETISFLHVFRKCPIVIRIKNTELEILGKIYNAMVKTVIASDNHNKRLGKYREMMLRGLE